MADLKISQLTDGNAAQAADEFVVARSGANFRIDGASVAAAATSVGTLSSLTVSGDLTVDTSTLKVDSANNRVGIGTASPAVRLDVVDTAAVARLRSSSSTAADAPRLRFFHEGNDEFHIAGGDGLLFYGGGTNLRMTLTGSGNLGLGVTPSASWSTANNYSAFQLRNASLYFRSAAAELYLNNNSIYNGTNWVYAANTTAARYDMEGAVHKWYTAASGSIGNTITDFSTAKMTLDASGKLGIGTGSPSNLLDVASTTSTDHTVASFAYRVGAAETGFYVNTNHGSGLVSLYASGNVSKSMRFMTGGTEVFRYDTSGNLLVNTTSNTAGHRLVINQNNSAGIAAIHLPSDESTIQGPSANTQILMGSNLGLNAHSTLLLRTDAAERARITSGGYFKASNTGTYNDAAGSYHELYQTAAGDPILVAQATNASYAGNGIQISAARNTTNNTFYTLGYFNTGAGAWKFRVADSGDVTNTNGTYGTISDAKLKHNIVDAGSQWDDLKAIRFRKYQMINDPSQRTMLGVVAQELELVSPGLIEEHPDTEQVEVPVLDEDGNETGETKTEMRPTETTTKSVKTSVLLMKAAVALQEAMARIEAMEASNAGLLARLEALEA